MTAPTGLFLRVTSGPDEGTMVAVDGPVVVGREGDLALSDPTVSRRHLVLEPTGPSGPALTVRDAGSANGFSIAGRQGRSGEQVLPGDQVTVGRSGLTVLRLIRHHETESGPHLLVEEPGGKVRAVPLAGTTVVGRARDADVVIDDPSVSRHHCTIRRTGDDVVVDDHSANGTTVGGIAIRGSARVADGDRIRCGTSDAVLHLEVRRAAAPTRAHVAVEGKHRGELVVVDAAAGATVAEVTLALADALGFAAPGLLLYRATDGVVLHPDDAWAATGPRHGDELVLARGDASAEAPAPGRHWPRPAPPPLNQLPRTVLPPTKVTIRPPDPPESLSWKGRGVMWQVIGGMGVVLMGAVMAIVRPDYALFGLMAGSIGILAIAASIFGEQSRRRHRLAEHRARLAELDGQLAKKVAEHDRAFRLLSPDLDELEAWLRSASPRLWERRPSDPDALRLRLGVGRRAFPVELDSHVREVHPALRDLLDRHRTVGPTPVLGPGPSTGSIGLVGDRSRATDLLRRCIVEAALLHPPEQLEVWVLAVDDQWDWCRWLPHTAGGERVSSSETEAGRLCQELVERIPHGTRDEDDEGPLRLVVVPRVWERSALEGLAGRLVGHGLLQVFAEHQRSLPSGIGTLLAIDPAGNGAVIGDFPDAPVGEVRIGRVSAGRAERLALGLARASGGGRSQTAEGIGDLLGLGPLTAVDVAASWATPPAEALTVPIGVDGTGAAVTVGFRRDGPHGMIAGTTGSGKSELLQTLLGALVLTHAPERLNLFLIDYKGGATFAPLAPLPHVVGVVTDLEGDSSLAERAFAALDAEIIRRKRALDAAGVPNLIAYEQLDPVEAPPMPNLLVVIDEFALMVKSQPELKERLDTVATQGRSLGIHLLLATQSPTGVITHAVRTNTNLWISLRVVADSESTELLGSRAAAQIPDGSPGRGYIRLGAGEHLRDLQAARIARPLPSRTSSVRVARPWTGLAVEEAPSSTTELEVAVERICDAWAATGRVAPSTLWLPPLPEDLAPSAVADTPTDPDRLVAVVGLADRPAAQRQDPHLVDLSSTGHLLVAGSRGYGKTTALLGVAADLAGRHGPGDLHLYGIDAGAGGLRLLEELPHTAAVVGAHDVERLTRLIDRIDRIAADRRDALAATASGDFLSWRTESGEPWVVVLIDDLATLKESMERIEAGRLAERLPSLLQNGPSVGIHLVLSISQQTDLRMREASLLPERLLLRMTDPADYAMVDMRVRGGEVPRLPPGRAVTNGPLHLQLVQPTLDDLTAVAKRWASEPTERRPRPVRRLPTSVARGDLPPSASKLLLGLGGPEVEPVGVDLTRGAPVLLVAGPIQSGRSTALLSALLGITEDEPDRRVLVVSSRPGPLRQHAAAAEGIELVTAPTDVCDALDRLLDAAGPAVVVIDDAEGLAGQLGVGERLDRLLRGASERGDRVLLGARLADLASIFEPWARFVTSLRRLVLLQPTNEEAFGMGLRLPPIPAPVGPGRGVLIDGSTLAALQVATP